MSGTEDDMNHDGVGSHRNRPLRSELEEVV